MTDRNDLTEEQVAEYMQKSLENALEMALALRLHPYDFAMIANSAAVAYMTATGLTDRANHLKALVEFWLDTTRGGDTEEETTVH